MILAVKLFPDPALSVTASSVSDVLSEEMQTLADNLIETLDAYHAEGLAATQVGEPHRVIVVRLEKVPVVLFNPVIVGFDNEVVSSFEGCLSFPGVMENVKRYGGVYIEATLRTGERKKVHLTGTPAVAVQHEVDHLDGLLYIDKVSSFVRGRMLRSYKKHKAKFGIR